MKENEIYYKSAIGADEVGTGEVLRPSVYVACYVSNSKLLMLEQLGVKDSKKMTRKKCCEIAKELIKIVPYKAYIITNEKHNEVYEKIPNMNKIKAIAHNYVLTKLFEEYNNNAEVIILDKFCSKEKFIEYNNGKSKVANEITFIEKAENVHLAVACASIIATYLEEKKIKELSLSLGEELPGGNTKKCLEFAKKMVNTYDKDILKKYAKTNFNMIQEILKS